MVFGLLAHLLIERPKPSFEVALFSATSDVMAGEEINVLLLVKNTTAISGEHTFRVWLDNRFEEREVYIRAKRTKMTFFTFVEQEPGEHEIRFENQSMKIWVDPYEPPIEDAEVGVIEFFPRPIKLTPMEEINIEVLVKNKSDYPGILPLEVKVGEEVMRRSILIRGGRTKIAVFTAVARSVGKLTIEVENAGIPSKTVTVSLF